MEVWVLEWAYPSDGETNVTVWDSQENAQKQALKEIEDVISNDWNTDPDDEDYDSHQGACADDIFDMMNRKQYAEAIRRFNDYQDDHNSDYAQYWFVSRKDVLGSSGNTSKTFHSSNGATCRGPCKQHNDYANPDRSDGTYVCRQCSTFKSIFGVSP